MHSPKACRYAPPAGVAPTATVIAKPLLYKPLYIGLPSARSNPVVGANTDW